MWERHSEYKGRVIFRRRPCEGSGWEYGVGSTHETGMVMEPCQGCARSMAVVRQIIVEDARTEAYFKEKYLSTDCRY